MSRFFAIYAGKEERLYTESDLPLAIGSADSCQIPLSGVEKIVATIDQKEGKYLFLKPSTTKESIFHNDQLITESAWIKSGDQTRIGEQVIVYRISGDRVEIIIKRYTIQESINNHQEQQTNLSDPTPLPPVSPAPDAVQGRRTRILASGLIFLLLLLAALFVLTAHTLEITIEPQPDSLTLQGSLPLLHLGGRYLGLKGVYHLQASKKGFQDLQENIVIADGKPASYTFSFKPLPGFLSVTSSPDGVEVWLDNALLGKTPLERLAVAGGTHELSCRAAEYKQVDKSLAINAGKQLSFHCAMEPAMGRVFLVSDPAGAVVSLEDKQLGVTPLTVELNAGEHTLLLHKEGYVSSTVELKIPGGETLTPPVVSLKVQQKEFTLSSVPKNAAVFEGKKQIGTTPLRLKWQPGSKHKLRLVHKGYADKIISLVAGAQADQQKMIQLTPVGKLEIETTPETATLLIDGKKQRNNQGIFILSTENHVIEARARGYKSAKQQIKPDGQKTKNVSFVLIKEAVKSTAQRPNPLPSQQPEKAGSVNRKTQLVRLAPGEFTMGSSRREAGRRANEGRHAVVLTRPFFLAVHEVTNGEFRRFSASHHAGNIGAQSLDENNFPVVSVSWQDAAAYCNWLSHQEGLAPFYKKQGATYVAITPFTNGYRLPFEAEWEFAARKVARTRPGSFPWDGRFPPRHPCGNYADEAARTLLPNIIDGYQDGFPVLAPVGNFPRNMAGLFNMGGNVAEWCHDWYSPIITPMSGKAVDPTGPASGTQHVYRGSSWRDGKITELRIAFRGHANTPKDSLGFRVARFIQ